MRYESWINHGRKKVVMMQPGWDERWLLHCYCVRPSLARAVFIKHPLGTSLSLSLLDIIMSSLILNGIFIGLPVTSKCLNAPPMPTIRIETFLLVPCLGPINIVLPKVWKRELVEQIVWVFSIIIFRQISKTQFCSEQGVAKTETWQ